MKIPSIKWIALAILTVLIGSTYLFLSFLEKQRVESIISRELGRFEYKISVINSFYRGLGEYAYELFLNDPFAKKYLESLVEAQKNSSEAFLEVRKKAL